MRNLGYVFTGGVFRPGLWCFAFLLFGCFCGLVALFGRWLYKSLGEFIEDLQLGSRVPGFKPGFERCRFCRLLIFFPVIRLEATTALGGKNP